MPEQSPLEVRTLSLAEQLRFYRERADLSQDDLGSVAHVHPRTISNVERGASHSPNTSTLDRLARGLRVTPEEAADFRSAKPHRTHPRAGVRQPKAPVLDTPGQAASPVPVWPSELVGRESELARIAGLIRQAERLIMLSGPPGVGKTRLAVEAATSAVTGQLSDGMRFVSLVPVTSADEAIGVIASSLGVPSRLSGSVSAIAEALGRGRQLLILDNLEQIGDTEGLLERLLEGIPRLRLITTSRHAILLREGHEIRIQPLSVVTGDPDKIPFDQVVASPAIRLLVTAGRRHQPGFELTRTNSAELVRLARMLDGLPLSLEIAAAQLRFHGPATLAELVAQEPGILLDARGGHAGNQRSLAATIEWSVNLLPEDARLALARLSVFLGGFSMQNAIRIITHDDTSRRLDDQAAFDSITTLVERHLVISAVNLTPNPGEEDAYVLLQFVREYAQSRLDIDRDAEGTRAAHARWVNDLARQCRDGIHGPDPGYWFRLMDREIGNVRVALDHCARRARSGDRVAAITGLEIAGRLWGYWRAGGAGAGGVANLASAIEAANGFPDESLGVPLSDALTSQAVLHMDLGQTGLARDEMKRALTICRVQGDRHGEADILSNLGLVAAYHDEPDEGRRLQQQALVIRRQVGNWQRIAMSLISLADIEIDHGNADAAERALREARAAAERADDRGLFGWVLLGEAEVEGQRGRLRAAAERLDRCRMLLQDTGDDFALGYVTELEGWLAYQGGRYRKALDRYRSSIRSWRSAGNRRGLIGAVEGIGLCLLASGLRDEAAILLHDAAAIRSRERIARWGRREGPYGAAYQVLDAGRHGWTSPEYAFTHPVQLDDLVRVAGGAIVRGPAPARRMAPRRVQRQAIRSKRRGSGSIVHAST